MNNDFFIAEITWDEDVRKIIPPEGTRYCPLFYSETNNVQECWSIDFICPNYPKENIIKARFLSDNAPMSLICINEIYHLKEGNKTTAKIRIISKHEE